MSASTNSLIAKGKKFAVPAGAVAMLLLAFAYLLGHNTAHAASAAASNGAAPLDDSSVSSLVALDNAVEAVAARVTPAVVNVCSCMFTVTAFLPILASGKPGKSTAAATMLHAFSDYRRHGGNRIRLKVRAISRLLTA